MRIQARFTKRIGEVTIASNPVDRDRELLRLRVEDASNVSLSSLARATDELRAATGDDVTRIDLFENAPAGPGWLRYRTPLRTRLSFFGDQVRVGVRAQPGQAVPVGPGMGLFDALQATTARHRGGISGLSGPDILADDSVLLQMWLAPRGRTIADCLSLGRDAALVIDAVFHGGGVTREAVVDLVRAGRADLLVGQREDQQLDVKRERYLPWDDKAKFELAKDVAAMANGGGGALVIGLGSSSNRQGDQISTVNPVPYDDRVRRQMQDVIRRWLHPVPVRVQVEIHDVPSARPQHGIVLVNIPAQLEELLPILVRRGVVSGRMSEMHVALVQRDGEETIVFDAPSLHSLLSAGRAALNTRS
jgi:hypothetical protein